MLIHRIGAVEKADIEKETLQILHPEAFHDVGKVKCVKSTTKSPHACIYIFIIVLLLV